MGVVLCNFSPADAWKCVRHMNCHVLIWHRCYQSTSLGFLVFYLYYLLCIQIHFYALDFENICCPQGQPLIQASKIKGITFTVLHTMQKTPLLSLPVFSDATILPKFKVTASIASTIYLAFVWSNLITSPRFNIDLPGVMWKLGHDTHNPKKFLGEESVTEAVCLWSLPMDHWVKDTDSIQLNATTWKKPVTICKNCGIRQIEMMLKASANEFHLNETD